MTRINEDLGHGDQTGTGTLRDSGQDSNNAPSFPEDTGRAQSVEVDNEHQPLIGPSASRSDNLRSRPGSSRSIQYGSSPPVSGSKDSNLPDRKVPPLSIKTVVAYAVLALHTTVFEEVYAVFALTPLVSHGLGWTSIQLSTSLAIMGLVQLLGQFIVYPELGRRFPSVWLFRISHLLYVATYVSFPIIRAFAVDEEDMETGGQTPRVRYLILTSLVIKYTCSVFAFTSVMVMVSYSSTSYAVEGASIHFPILLTHSVSSLCHSLARLRTRLLLTCWEP
jgi:hypothetical protein